MFELYTYLKSYEPHAMKTLKKQEQSTSTVDPLAYLAQPTHYHAPTQTTSPPPPQYGPLTSSTSQQVPQSRNDAMLATMNQIVNLLSGFQKQFPPTNKPLKTSVQLKESCNCAWTGILLLKPVRGIALDKMLLMEAKEKGTVLDAEAEAFLADVECTAPYDQPLAITTTNMFEVSHEDAYDSDVDEGPHAAAAFMANLSSTSGTNGATTSQVNEMTLEPNTGHLKVNQEQSLVNDSLRAELARCKQEMVSLERNKVKHDLDQTIIQRNKRNAELEEENVLLKSKLSQNVVSINSLKNESKKVVSEKKFLEDNHFVSSEGTVPRTCYWLPAEELATQIKVTEYMRIFDELDTEYEHCVLANKNLNIERKNLLIQNDYLIANSLEKDICSNLEHSKVVELEAEILKKQQMLNESEKCCAFIEKNHVKGTASREKGDRPSKHANSDQHHEKVECEKILHSDECPWDIWLREHQAIRNLYTIVIRGLKGFELETRDRECLYEILSDHKGAVYKLPCVGVLVGDDEKGEEAGGGVWQRTEVECGVTMRDMV
ncbi:hypothetical protein Tco_0678857 [Tanacetum coccineum]|uniref:Uncharacterized protein n=1 Tax=Tanacetum coccineum TaxID=301880 RepID=A0ABQ4XH70_9ASTR